VKSKLKIVGFDFDFDFEYIIIIIIIIHLFMILYLIIWNVLFKYHNNALINIIFLNCFNYSFFSATLIDRNLIIAIHSIQYEYPYHHPSTRVITNSI